MENAAAIAGDWAMPKARKHYGIDTLLVMFFLAMDTGRGMTGSGPGEILSFFTIATFVVFSYFLPSPAEKPDVAGWVGTRLFVAFAGFIFGTGFKVVSEVFLMESFKYLPMTFLILTGILCAATQIRGIIRVRLAG